MDEEMEPEFISVPKMDVTFLWKKCVWGYVCACLCTCTDDPYTSTDTNKPDLRKLQESFNKLFVSGVGGGVCVYTKLYGMF